MKTQALLAEAWSAMRVNRMRTSLTMLGLIIGVAAVIAMLAVGNGARNAVNEVVSSMGSNLIIVLSGAQRSGGVHFSAGSAPTLTLEDARAIRSLRDVNAVTPTSGGAAQLVYGPNNWNTSVSGVNQDYLRIRNWPLAEGSNFSASEIRSAARVAVIGQTVAEKLFGSADPLGHVIRVSRSPYLVTGLLAPKGQSLRGQDQDDVVLVPITTALRKLFGSQFVDSVRFIMVQGDSPEVLGQIQREIEALLRQRHHIPPGKEADFSVRNLTEIVNAAMSTTRIMSLLLGAIASISLIVGGIGIMNIMLVSVSERTREIGLRMAIGARPADILQQFLAEALLVSLGGCLIGLLIGVGAIEVVKLLFGLNSQVTLTSVLIAFAVSLAVGVFFGFYPARKAARLEPIEALRYQ